ITNEIIARDGTVARQSADIAAREREIGRLTSELGERDSAVLGLSGEIATLRTEVAHRDDTIAAILNSKTWRLTEKPRALYARLLATRSIAGRGLRYYRSNGARATALRAYHAFRERPAAPQEVVAAPIAPAAPAPSAPVALAYTPLISVV